MTNNNTYDIGDKVRLTAIFEVNNTPTDPSTVKFKIQTPLGVSTTYTYGTDTEVIKTASGVYYLDVTVNDDGKWYYRVEGTGSVVAAYERWFEVRKSKFYS